MMASAKKAGETPVAVGEDLWSPSDLLGYIHLGRVVQSWVNITQG